MYGCALAGVEGTHPTHSHSQHTPFRKHFAFLAKTKKPTKNKIQSGVGKGLEDDVKNPTPEGSDTDKFNEKPLNKVWKLNEVKVSGIRRHNR